ncbi:MAG: ATP-binding protein [Nannocystaceae bacterium]
MQRPLAEIHGIELSVDDTLGWPKILGDQSKLMQVFVNLVVNALDADREAGGRTILINHAVEHDHLVIRIEDEGPGMPAEVASQLFRPFFSTKAQGTGLGLAIVKKIVDLHGGTIALRPRERQGTVAEVRLRLAPPVRGE